MRIYACIDDNLDINCGMINKRKMRNEWIEEGLLSGREGCPVSSLSWPYDTVRPEPCRKKSGHDYHGGKGGEGREG